MKESQIEGSFRFFTDILSISYKPVEGVEGHYSNYSDRIKTEGTRF
jgi:hypothetical protein